MEVLICSACFKPFNATKCVMGGTLNDRAENVCCPHCRHVHYRFLLRSEQAEIKKCLTKLKKTLDI